MGTGYGLIQAPNCNMWAKTSSKMPLLRPHSSVATSIWARLRRRRRVAQPYVQLDPYTSANAPSGRPPMLTRGGGVTTAAPPPVAPACRTFRARSAQRCTGRNQRGPRFSYPPGSSTAFDTQSPRGHFTTLSDEASILARGHDGHRARRLCRCRAPRKNHFPD